MKLLRYLDFITESVKTPSGNYLPTYEECQEMCARDGGAFYETKCEMDGFNVSIFNYRLAQYSDFVTPIPGKPNVKAYEMRGLTFVFNEDGTLYNRFLLLEKFFNLNQVPESMYEIVKNYKIRYVNNKEDGSIASFIRLPNGTVYGKSKMSFESDQAKGITRIYQTNTDVQNFVNWCLDADIVPIFEYVAPFNRIVLRYSNEELILLRLRDNKTGKHLDIKEHLDKIGKIKIAPFEDDHTLDGLIELGKTEIDKEGWVVQATDEFGNDKFWKQKTDWYCQLHGLLTDDLYREHILIGYILDDKIDDVIAQIPLEEKEARVRIEKMISIVQREVADKVAQIDKMYQVFVNMGQDRKAFALKHIKDPNFAGAMSHYRYHQLKNMSPEEIADRYNTHEDYEKSLKRGEKYEIAKDWVREQTKRLELAREWLKDRDPSLFFKDPVENEEEDN